MSVLRTILIIMSLLLMLVIFSGPMTVFLHYLTMVELYVRANPLPSFIFGGIVWTYTLGCFVSDYMRVFRPKKIKYWIIDEKYLKIYDGYFEGKLSQHKPKILREVNRE